MACAIMMAAAASAEPQKVAPFSKVSVNVPARIRVIKGNEYSIMVNTQEPADSSSLRYTVEKGILRISTICDDMRQASGRGTVITIVSPEDTNITTGSALEMEDVQATSVRQERHKRHKKNIL